LGESAKDGAGVLLAALTSKLLLFLSAICVTVSILHPELSGQIARPRHPIIVVCFFQDGTVYLKGPNHMPCDECERLQQEEVSNLRSLQEQRYINRQSGLRGKQAKELEQGLERAYSLARAKTRLHKGTCHKDESHKVTIEDLNIFVRNGRTRP
jgi:hypothetical protein